MPTAEQLTEALSAAGQAHHDYETNYLRGVRDEHWPGWYAAYVLGRLGEFTSATQLTHWLTEVSSNGDWAHAAAAHVVSRLPSS